MLAVTPLKDFGGLPRELTGVGSYVYFALDSGVDGHLSYVDLVEYNLTTGTQRSIVKSGGKKFGQTQYYLSERDGALIVKEERSQNSFMYDYWRVPQGKTTATRIDAPSAEDSTPQVSEPVPIRPRAPSRRLTEIHSMTALDANRYVFIARDAGKSRLFTVGLDGRGVKQLDVPVSATHGAFVRFTDVAVAAEGRLVVTYDTASRKGLALYSNGTQATTVQAPPSVYGERSGLRLIAERRGRVLMAQGSISADTLISTDGTAEGTRDLGASYLGRTAWLGDTLIMARTGLDYSQEELDPESLGGYVAPGGYTSGVTRFVNVYQSQEAAAYDFANDRFEVVSPLTDVALMQPFSARMLISGAPRADDNGRSSKTG